MPTPCRYGNGGTGNTKKLKSLGIDRCKMNPNHQEWLMMWPQGWTELTAPATDKFRLWCESHGIPCGVAEGANAESSDASDAFAATICSAVRPESLKKPNETRAK